MGDMIDNDDYPSDLDCGHSCQPIHYCGVKEEFKLSGRLFPIPELVWTWWFEGRLPGLANDRVEATIQAAISTWSKVCRLTFKQAATRQSANVLIVTESIDGPLTVLADAQLYTGQKQQKLRLDLEKFVESFNPGPGYIGLPHVVAHEWGHIILFPHLEYDGTPDLMNPQYNPQIWEPQADESGIARKTFGAPLALDPAPPVPASKTVKFKDVREISQDGKVWRATVEGEYQRVT